MNPSDLKIRFDELCAGRALGDLSLEEERELMALAKDHGWNPDLAFDMLAASLELNAGAEEFEPLPASLSARLHQWADQTATQPPANVIQPTIPAWKTFAAHPATGWAAAAAVLVFMWVQKPGDRPLPPPQAEARLRAEAPDVIERTFSGLGDFKQAGGKVIWSDQLQKGYMTLTGIPTNDPQKAQYQLWIVDPTRDADAPVDGGVFDIPSDGSPVVIPIAAKLALNKPQAFVITLEQPGGVVKSKQEKVVALAKS